MFYFVLHQFPSILNSPNRPNYQTRPAFSTSSCLYFYLFIFITVAHVAHLALCLNHYLLFMFGSPSPWKLLHVWQRALKESESGGVQQRGLRALRNWPTSSVIMAGSWNEAFGSTPGFREQRCEPLMLAAEPAWHLLPFPSSPCHGCLPSLPPSLPPLLGLQRGSE